MSVYRQILGRELPCVINDLLKLHRVELNSSEFERLHTIAQVNRADAADLRRLGAAHLSRGELGLARARLRDAVQLDPDAPAARLTLAVAHESLAEHDQAAAQIDAVLATRSEAPSESSGPSRYQLTCA